MDQVNLQKSTLLELVLWILRFRKRYRVTGTSMLPLLHPGDSVLVDHGQTGAGDLSQGDLVIAQHPYMRDVQMLKYIAEIGSDGRLKLRGLNPMESTDSAAFGPLSPEDIVGRVTSRLS